MITLLAWANSFESGFVLDNAFLLLRDSRIREATLANLGLIFHHTYWWPNVESGLYRPVTTLSYLFNYAILGNADRPAGYHWINVLLHTGNVLLVFALARRLVRDLWPSFLIAAVWAVHPVLTESVTNMVGRSDLLAGMTSLGGLLIYLEARESSGRRRLGWLLALMAVTAVGVFCKESAVAILGIVALFELAYWDSRQAAKAVNGFTLGCLAMSPAFLAMWWIRSRVLAESAPAMFPFIDNLIVEADFWTGRLTAVKVMAKYLGLLVWPARLSSDYSYAQIPLVSGRPADWIAWFVMAAVAGCVVFLYRRNGTAFFGAGFALVTFLPMSNLVIPVGTIMAERFLYLPAIGFSICLVLALYSIGGLVRVRALAPALLCMISVMFAARTWVRNGDWRDEVTLWSAAVRASPLSFKTHTGLAQAWYAQHRDLDDVISENERSLAILASLPDRLSEAGVYLRTGAQYIEKGDSLRRRDAGGKLLNTLESTSKYERANALLLHCLTIVRVQHQVDMERGKSGGPEPAGPGTDFAAYLVLSDAEERLGEADSAIHSTREAQLRGPMEVLVYQRMHELLLAAGRRDEAMAALMEGVLLTSNKSLEQKLVADYAERPDEAKCAISYAAATPALDFSCGIVRQLACSVSGLKRDLAAKYGCRQ